MNEMVRVNTRLAVDLNDWFDAESKKSGLSKSAMIMMAAESYRREKETFRSIADLDKLDVLVAKIKQLEDVIQRKGLE